MSFNFLHALYMMNFMIMTLIRSTFLFFFLFLGIYAIALAGGKTDNLACSSKDGLIFEGFIPVSNLAENSAGPGYEFDLVITVDQMAERLHGEYDEVAGTMKESAHLVVIRDFKSGVYTLFVSKQGDGAAAPRWVKLYAQPKTLRVSKTAGSTYEAEFKGSLSFLLSKLGTSVMTKPVSCKLKYDLVSDQP